MKTVTITFHSLSDFESRIAGLWQDQKNDEVYDFIFPDEKTEKAFYDLVMCFADGQQGARYESRID